MIQVASFKRTGKRVFLMAPIHHHFEMKAWSETKIMVRFWIVGRDPLHDRVRALLPLLPPLQAVSEGSRCRDSRGRAGLLSTLSRRRAPTSSPTTARRPMSTSRASPPMCGSARGTTPLLDGVDLVVKSPGVPDASEPVVAARAPGHLRDLGDRARRAAARRTRSSVSRARTARRRRRRCSARCSTPPASGRRWRATSAGR